MLLLTQIESRLCIVGSSSHEFIIIAFYDEGAGLVALYWVRLNRFFVRYTFLKLATKAQTSLWIEMRRLVKAFATSFISFFL